MTLAGGGVSCGFSSTAAADSPATARRLDALRRARVWLPPTVPIEQADLRANPAIGPDLVADRDLSCRFDVAVVGGLTPKFPCTTAAGEHVKVRYGASNPEIPAELAASRLLSALGFPTDPVYSVRSVECQGCPSMPFFSLRCFRTLHSERACMPFRDQAARQRFAPVLVERRFDGRAIESPEAEGWSWHELDVIDHARGASRAEVDTLRLMAVLLAHWDNKDENQRLVCPAGAERGDGGCDRPLAMIADLGGSFGPLKVNLGRWASVPMWVDSRACDVSMETLPYAGGTFPRHRITEGGRRLAADLLSRLSSRQLQDLFGAAGFDNVPSWVEAFRDKVAQIQAAGPCPSE